MKTLFALLVLNLSTAQAAIPDCFREMDGFNQGRFVLTYDVSKESSKSVLQVIAGASQSPLLPSYPQTTPTLLRITVELDPQFMIEWDGKERRAPFLAQLEKMKKALPTLVIACEPTKEEAR